MKYLYKQTGVVVESSIPLDSSIFAPVEKKEDVKPAKGKKKTTAKRETSKEEEV